MILPADSLHGAFGRKPAQHLDGQLRPHAADRNQPLKEALLFAVEKAEQRNLILADLGVNAQLDQALETMERVARRIGVLQ